ncbi:3-isopropylmalate dehydrogenase [Falsiruegeria mediterranea]
MSGPFKVLALGGDHIGPEVVGAGLRVLLQTADQFGVGVEVEEDLLGGASWDVHGTFCTDAVVDKARAADAILVGAVGGPEWDGIRIDGPITETDGLTRLRIELDVYNALRPARAWSSLLSRTPYRKEIVDGADLLVVRENSGGVYYGEPRGREVLSDGQVRAYEISEYRTSEVERIARCAFEAARGRRGYVTSLDKSNVMESGKLWRETVERIGRDEYPDVELQHLLMDYALFAVARAPKDFDVLLADNLFGDLISDLIAVISGSLGMLPSATLPAAAREASPVKGGLYEPTHGSAPDISGRGIANPIGAILSVAMMFEYGFGCAPAARAIVGAVDSVLNAGVLPPDLGGTADTGAVTQAVLGYLRSSASWS